jgi:hypothetical protein
MEATADKLPRNYTVSTREVKHILAAVLGGLHHRRLLVIVLFATIFSFDVARDTDIDFWWHVRTGELIAESGTIPTVDTFSYSALGRPWIAHEWLWDLAVFIVCRHGGYVLAVLLSAAIVTLTYVIIYRTLRQLGANEIVSGVIVLWAAVLALPCIGVRPREWTHCLLAYYLSRLLLYREGRVRHLWLLPPLMALWVNLHGAFVFGVGVVALFLADETVRWLFADGKPPRHLLRIGVATLAAVALNPWGPRMLLYPFNYYVQHQNPSFSIVTEFQSPNFHEPMNLLFAAGIVGFMLLSGKRHRYSFVEGLLIGVFTLQALVSARQVSIAALVLAPLLGRRLCDRFRFARALPAPRLPARLVALNWLLLAALVVFGALYVGQPKVSRALQLGWEPNVGDMPVAGARFIEQEHLPGPVFNSQAWGGYLIHRWYPDRRVFIDGRIDMYGPDIVREYIQVVTIQPEWRAVLSKYGVRTVLIPKGSPLSVLLLADGGWKHVFEGQLEDIFVRSEGR